MDGVCAKIPKFLPFVFVANVVLTTPFASRNRMKERGKESVLILWLRLVHDPRISGMVLVQTFVRTFGVFVCFSFLAVEPCFAILFLIYVCPVWKPQKHVPRSMFRNEHKHTFCYCAKATTTTTTKYSYSVCQCSITFYFCVLYFCFGCLQNSKSNSDELFR